MRALVRAFVVRILMWMIGVASFVFIISKFVEAYGLRFVVIGGLALLFTHAVSVEFGLALNVDEINSVLLRSNNSLANRLSDLKHSNFYKRKLFL